MRWINIVAFLSLSTPDQILAWSEWPPSANFATFEHTVNAIYSHVLTKNKNEYSQSTQLGVSFAAGYVSGLVSTVVSHPADSLLSLRARYPDKTYKQIIDLVGWKQLATQGLIPKAALTGTIIASQ